MSSSYASYRSPISSALTLLLQGQDPETQARIVQQLLASGGPKTEHDADIIRKREMRSQAARIEIPDCVNPARRERCLADPELFLKTYFASRYSRPFGKHHHQMIETIHSRAKYGGRQAVAAPRGCGKSELVKGMLVYLVLAGTVRFPLPVASTTPHAAKLYKDFQKKIATNDLLLEDFPEVCYPVRALDGAPQRAGKQHVDGKLTEIVWTAANYLSLPKIEGSPYGGVKMAYFGLDAAFRGINIDGDRPDFVLVDDPETRESAKSLMQIDDRERILDQDVAGLAGEDKQLAIVVLTTVQNCYCLSYRLTERKTKPAWNGLRFGTIEKWPDNLDMWEDYVAMRNADQATGDEHGRSAIQFYLDNREAMDAGAEMLTDHFTPEMLDDGTQLTHSALQVAWNKIADTNMSAFRTEYQNDPEPEEEIESLRLTAARVQSRLSGLPRGDIPSDTLCRTIGIDLGKYASHWVDIAWAEEGCVGTIVDYGIMETTGLNSDSDNKSIELALLQALEVWSEDVADRASPTLVLIDSGTWTQSAYELARRRGTPYFAAKGWDAGRFRMPRRTNTQVPFLEAYARHQPEDQVWLYHVQGEYWKSWMQQRFLTQTFDEAGARVNGSLALFDNEGDPKRHLSFSHHMVAEEEQLVPVDGKAMKRVWRVKNRNNHWLDAAALACAAAGCIGIRLVEPTQQTPEQPRETGPTVSTPKDPYGRPFLITQR